MFNVPQQDWSLYDSIVGPEEEAWIRGLSPQDRFAIYEGMFNLVSSARRSADEIERLEQMRWDQKLELRSRLVEAFNQLDQFRRERAAANNTR